MPRIFDCNTCKAEYTVQDGTPEEVLVCDRCRLKLEPRFNVPSVKFDQSTRKSW